MSDDDRPCGTHVHPAHTWPGLSGERCPGNKPRKVAKVVDIFCSRCDAMDGVNPNDHKCLYNLEVKFEELVRTYARYPGAQVDLTEFPHERLISVERDLNNIYEKMQEVVEWYSKELERAQRERDTAYNKKQVVRKWVNSARHALREKLEDV